MVDRRSSPEALASIGWKVLSILWVIEPAVTFKMAAIEGHRTLLFHLSTFWSMHVWKFHSAKSTSPTGECHRDFWRTLFSCKLQGLWLGTFASSPSRESQKLRADEPARCNFPVARFDHLERPEIDCRIGRTVIRHDRDRRTSDFYLRNGSSAAIKPPGTTM